MKHFAMKNQGTLDEYDGLSALMLLWCELLRLKQVNVLVLAIHVIFVPHP